ncbi:TetR/AcrR family transcriptional regulator [Bacillus sp. AFS017336]|uniref:TetR/AcrR family transcriptional regulator n=1 Tax=Bacillus sp. AFS017336 TaxID=2033489 RepID=UPI000BF1E610|nr:TetR/AcrR family transcriptional regulator [Bacillus sp. AFS017336]PEL08127.1 TetR family transcriptional regulator [Bacillus sp. AFS017336]
MKENSQLNSSFQLILSITEKLIEEKGCRKTTMQDIIDRTGLSKGAIYHYVTGKDELFGLIMKARIGQVDTKFLEVVSQKETIGINDPLKVVASGVAKHSTEQDVTTKIFIYLLSRVDNQKVEEILKDVYLHSLATSTKWIKVGQEEGAIPLSVDAEKMANLFLTFMYGLRVQNTMNKENSKINMSDIFEMMFRTLQ